MIKFEGKSEVISTTDLEDLIDRAIEDDDEIEFSNVIFNVQNIDGKKDLMGIYFKGCVFLNGVKISNIERGSNVSIVNCIISSYGIVFDNLVLWSLVLLNNEFKRSKYESIEDFGSGILDHKGKGFVPEAIVISKVVSNKAKIQTQYFDLIIDSLILLDEIRFISCGDTDKQSFIQMTSCYFAGMEMVFTSCNLKYLDISDTKRLDKETDERGYRNGLIAFAESKVKEIRFSKTNLPHIAILLANIPLRKLVIEDSSLSIESYINLYMESSIEEDDRKIDRLIVKDSKIGGIDVRGRHLIGPVDFQDTIFFGAPYFHGVEIPQGSLFPDYDNFKKKEGVENIKAYRTLRLAMEAQRAREEEGLFFVLEQESILNTYHKSRKYFSVNYWYKIMSSYGTNYSKPVTLLAVSFPIFAFIYALIASPVIGFQYEVDWGILNNSAIFSLKQIFVPFNSLKELYPIYGDKTSAHFLLRIIAVSQSIVSISLISLSILAIRWKFKR